MGLWLYVNVSIQLFFQMPKSILFPTWKKAKEKKKICHIFFLKSVKIAKLSAIKSKAKHDTEVQECSIWL